MGGISVAVVGVISAMTITEVAATVAVTGAVLGTIGAATGNKNLKLAGMAMGIAGGVVGIGAGLAGIGGMTLGDAGSAISNFMSGPAPTAAESAYLTGMDAAAGHTGLTPVAETGAAQEAAGQAIVNNTPIAPTDAHLAATAPMTGPSQASLGEGIINATQQNMAASQQAAGITPPANPAEMDYMATQAAATQAPAAPEAPSVDKAITGSISQQGQPGAGTVLKPEATIPAKVAGEDLTSWYARIPDWAKAQLAISVGQGAAGLAGGYFQGLSAEERLELEKLINSQNQAQRELYNRNNAYAPKISFSRTSGMINAGSK